MCTNKNHYYIIFQHIILMIIFAIIKYYVTLHYTLTTARERI